MTNGEHTEPEKFKDIFERGIDPDVDDPTKIHVSHSLSGVRARRIADNQAHSEVPLEEADWPSLDEILGFRDRVRERLRGIYDAIASGEMALTRKTGRVLFMTFEHEAMHAETLLYMLAQSPLTRPPSAAALPDWQVLAARWAEEAEENRVLEIPAGEVAMGHHDLEADDASHPTAHGWEDHQFGWDNEHPEIVQSVKAFKVDSLPITNAQYLEYLRATRADMSKADALPASWQQVDGEWKVRSLYGPLDFDIAGQWPLMASKVEIDGFAKWKGGRLPTEAELRWLWESPDGPRPNGIRANTAFKNWHPVP